MAPKQHLTQEETLEQYRVTFDNVEKQPEIAKIIKEFSYTKAELDKGKALLKTAREAYNQSKIENDETAVAYNNFKELKQQLEEHYNTHRKRAKVIFKNDTVTQDRLAIKGALPQAYVNKVETLRKFYHTALSDSEIQKELVRLKVTVKELNEGEQLLSKLETARSEYIKEKGESQRCHQSKIRRL